MKIYNYLFYKSYELSIRSTSFNDTPVLGGIVFVVVCLMFNLFGLSCVLQGLGLLEKYPFTREYKYPFVILLVILVLLYYLYKGRYKRIINLYQERERKSGGGLPPILVIIIYYITSFALLLMAGLLKNGDWIFSE